MVDGIVNGGRGPTKERLEQIAREEENKKEGVKKSKTELTVEDKIFDILDKKADEFNLRITVGQGKNITKTISEMIKEKT